MKPNLVVYKIVLIPLNGEVNIHSGGSEGITRDNSSLTGPYRAKS